MRAFLFAALGLICVSLNLVHVFKNNDIVAAIYMVAGAMWYLTSVVEKGEGKP